MAHDKSAVIVPALTGSYYYSNRLTWEMCRNNHNSLLLDVIPPPIDILWCSKKWARWRLFKFGFG